MFKLNNLKSNFTTNIKRVLINLGTIGAILFAKLIKFSYLVGSQASFFSGINIVAPMAGILGGLSGALVALSTKLAWGLITGAGLWSLFMGYLPHLLASYYWCTKFKLFRIIYPLACLVIFVTGTSLIYGFGASAGLYSCLWLIPAVIGFLDTNNKFLLALGSTFCAHATGSLIWLALVPMTNLQWVSLIPVALVERCLFAAGMYAVYLLLNYFKISNFATISNSESLSA
jgi:hypothetical protein